jgi:hypothetical protein
LGSMSSPVLTDYPQSSLAGVNKTSLPFENMEDERLWLAESGIS